MNSFRPILAVQLVTVLIFFALKQSRAALAQAFPNEAFEIFLYSFPNFAEGIVGFLIVAMMLTIASRNVEALRRFMSLPLICCAAFLGAAAYVIAQEMGLHNLGGAQVYDPYDAAFSVAGLILGLAVFVWLRPTRTSA